MTLPYDEFTDKKFKVELYTTLDATSIYDAFNLLSLYFLELSNGREQSVLSDPDTSVTIAPIDWSGWEPVTKD